MLELLVSVSALPPDPLALFCPTFVPHVTDVVG